MCRLFFSFMQSNIDEKIHDFLKQSHHTKKHTPGIINNPRDDLTHPDGFGLAWRNARKKWQVYKTPKKYNEIRGCNIAECEVVESEYRTPVKYSEKIGLDKTIVRAEHTSDIIIGHIRLATDSKSAYENTHPFLYQNQLFLQNGYIANFAEHKNELVKYVDASLLKHVQGDTDTELLFYMFLTIKTRREKKHNDVTVATKHKILVESIRELFRIFKDKNIEISANLIYAEERYIVITRYLTYDKSKYKKEQIPPSLYYDTKDGLLITSEPITPHFTIVPANKMIIIDSEKSKMIIMDV